MANIKLRIRFGDAELEVEGAKSEVDALASDWWARVAGSVAAPSPSPVSALQAPHAPRATGKTARSTSAKRSSSSSTAAQSSDADGDGDADGGIDSNTIANKIKNSHDFDKHAAAILHARDRFAKVAFVCYSAGVPLKSGFIHKTLNALGVKISLSGVSDTLATNRNKFINSVPRKLGSAPAYALTGKAASDFKKVLDAAVAS